MNRLIHGGALAALRVPPCAAQRCAAGRRAPQPWDAAFGATLPSFCVRQKGGCGIHRRCNLARRSSFHLWGDENWRPEQRPAYHFTARRYSRSPCQPFTLGTAMHTHTRTNPRPAQTCQFSYTLAAPALPRLALHRTSRRSRRCTLCCACAVASLSPTCARLPRSTTPTRRFAVSAMRGWIPGR